MRQVPVAYYYIVYNVYRIHAPVAKYPHVPIQLAWRLLLGFGAVPTLTILYALLGGLGILALAGFVVTMVLLAWLYRVAPFLRIFFAAFVGSI